MRADLVALTTEALVVLSNAGLVKRAQKELAEGRAPKIEERPDGTVVATSKDGATTTLPPETPLSRTQCSCGSSTVCRHRLAAVLAYQAQHASAGAAPEPVERWSPAEFSDDALTKSCGPATVELARKELGQSLVVTVGWQPSGAPFAQLPSCTVQFLVPHQLAFARCDCVRVTGCEHVVRAVWAFREKPEGGVVELGRKSEKTEEGGLEGVEALLERISLRGMSEQGWETLLTQERARAEHRGARWLADALEDLERQKEFYDRQGTLYSARRCALLMAEIAMRLRAARAPNALPASWVLGTTEAKETLLDQLRLVSLGCRLDADDRRRFAHAYFADPDSRAVLVLEKEWIFAPDQAAPNGHQLGEKFASSRMSLSSLAHGEVVIRGAKRRANGLLDLGTARSMKASVLPAAPAWDLLPAPVLIEDVEAHARAIGNEVPRMLKPRLLGESVHVIAISQVDEVAYDRARQELRAALKDKAGNILWAQVRHRAVAPGAVDSAYAAFTSGTVQFVSGELTRSEGGWELTPLGIILLRSGPKGGPGATQLVVPDLAKPLAANAPPSTPSAAWSERTVIDDLEELVDRGVHRGAAAIRADIPAVARRLEAHGLSRVAEQLNRVQREGPAALVDLCIVRALLCAN